MCVSIGCALDVSKKKSGKNSACVCFHSKLLIIYGYTFYFFWLQRDAKENEIKKFAHQHTSEKSKRENKKKHRVLLLEKDTMVTPFCIGKRGTCFSF